MCGRLALFSDAQGVASHFGLAGAVAFPPRWNQAPRQPLAVVRADAAGDGRELRLLEWGLQPPWAKPDRPGPRPINARLEGVAERPLFRAAWRRRRCLVPADGWYEWQAEAGGRQPWFCAAEDAGLLALGGLWERWQGADGSVLESVAIVTRPATAALAWLHQRMPLLLDPDDYAAWLDPRHHVDPDALGQRRAATLTSRRVSRRVNDPRHEGPELLATA
ncbi:MAG TPA: SOS response-associated peptidase [Gammaproteobacteria bacterium]